MFKTEAERLKAREAMVEAVRCTNWYVGESVAENFDRLYPPIVDAAGLPRTAQAWAKQYEERTSAPSSDFAAAVDALLRRAEVTAVAFARDPQRGDFTDAFERLGNARAEVFRLHQEEVNNARTPPAACRADCVGAVVSAMPERSARSVNEPTTFNVIVEIEGERFVPEQRALDAESRLLAAEARVREVEAELGAALDQVMLFGSDIDCLRADLAALEPLARLGLMALDHEDGMISAQAAIATGVLDERFADTPVVAQARAILARHKEDV